MTIENIARVCHEANRAYCFSIGDSSQKPWDEAEEWQRQSAIKGVEFALVNPRAPASALHEAWLKTKKADGWSYGPVKSELYKSHPCMVPYSALPLEQRVTDHIFRAIVRAMVDTQ